MLHQAKVLRGQMTLDFTRSRQLANCKLPSQKKLHDPETGRVGQDAKAFRRLFQRWIIQQRTIRSFKIHTDINIKTSRYINLLTKIFAGSLGRAGSARPNPAVDGRWGVMVAGG